MNGLPKDATAVSTAVGIGPNATTIPPEYRDLYNATQCGKFTIARTLPPVVGYWNIGGKHGVRFAIYERPTNQQITNHLELLGWVWEEVL